MLVLKSIKREKLLVFVMGVVVGSVTVGIARLSYASLKSAYDDLLLLARYTHTKLTLDNTDDYLSLFSLTIQRMLSCKFARAPPRDLPSRSGNRSLALFWPRISDRITKRSTYPSCHLSVVLPTNYK